MSNSITMAPVAKDDPLMIAWNAYCATPDFENTKKWATQPEHTQGSLWAAFSAGFATSSDSVRNAAPDLYAALSDCMNDIDPDGRGAPRLSYREAARAALKKARGEA